MNIDITTFFTDADPSEFSASIAETGHTDIGKRTWRAAVAESERKALLTTVEEIEALRGYVKSFGAWSDEEIAAWSDMECNALFVQLISGDMREGGLDQIGTDLDAPEWRMYEERAEAGRCSGNISKSANGKVYYSLSH